MRTTLASSLWTSGSEEVPTRPSPASSPKLPTPATLARGRGQSHPDLWPYPKGSLSRHPWAPAGTSPQQNCEAGEGCLGSCPPLPSSCPHLLHPPNGSAQHRLTSSPGSQGPHAQVIMAGKDPELPQADTAAFGRPGNKPRPRWLDMRGSLDSGPLPVGTHRDTQKGTCLGYGCRWVCREAGCAWHNCLIKINHHPLLSVDSKNSVLHVKPPFPWGGVGVGGRILSLFPFERKGKGPRSRGHQEVEVCIQSQI